MRMDRTLRFSILAIVALFALVAITGLASADPSDVNNEPTEDWVFDSGNAVIIRNKVWTLSYNITVTGGSSLRFDGCTFTIDGVSAFDPVRIETTEDSTLEIASSQFYAKDDSSGFYVEAHDNMTITDCDFKGLVANPVGDVGITVYGDESVKV